MQYRQIVSELVNSPVLGICIYQEKEGNIVFANDYFLKLTGYDKKELLKKSLFDLFPKNIHENLIEPIEKRVNGEFFSKKYDSLPLISKTKAVLKVQIFAHTIIYKSKPSGFVMVIDKTKEESFKKLFFALSQVNQLMVQINDEEKLLSSICDILVNTVGYSATTIGYVDEETKLFKVKYTKSIFKEAEDIMRNATISVDPNTPYGKGTVSRTYNSKKIIVVSDVLSDMGMSYWRYYFERFDMHSSCSMPIFKNGKIKYVLVIQDSVRDSFNQDEMHLLKEMQSDLSFALEKIENTKNMTTLNTALEKTHEWVVISDAKGNIIYANKAVSDISGFSNDEIIGQNPRIFKSGVHTKEFYEKLWDTVLSGKQYSCRFTNKAKNGSIFYLDSIIMPIKSNGKIERFVDLSRDVTDIVRQKAKIEMQSKLYNTLYQINDMFIKSKDEDEFLNKLTDIFVDYLDVEFSFIIEKSKNVFDIYAKSAREQIYLDVLDKLQKFLNDEIDKERIKRLPLIKSMKKNNIYLINDIEKNFSKLIGSIVGGCTISSCCALPIIKESESIGSIVLASKHKDIFDKSVYNLLKIITSEIEFMLNRFAQDRFSNILLTALNMGFDFVVITDKNFNITYVNQATLSAFGYKKEELIGRHHSIVSSKTQSKEFIKNFYDTLHKGETFSGMITYKDKSGNLIHSYTTIVPYKINKKIKYYIAVGKNITKEKRLKNQLENFANYDQLTGLYNIASFKESINQFISYSERRPQIGAVVIINPLNFANINQAFGFEAGNSVLQQIAMRLKEFLRSYDIIAKLESDRFGILFKDLAQEEDILVITANLLNKLKYPYKINNNEIALHFNAGLSMYPKDATTTKQLIDRAHIALIDAKSKGEDSIGFFREELDKKATDKLKLKYDLEKALKNKEFLLYYQPCVDAKENIIAAESLIRWRKNGKIVPPSDFIDYLEKTYLIIDVEDYVLDKVMKKIKQLKQSKPIKISVNLSSKSLKNSYLVKRISNKIKWFDIPKELLAIEIVERSFMDNLEKTKQLIEELNRIGVTFSIDDFGTGYSSLSYLAQLSVEYLKIDISFTRKVTTDKKTRNIVKSIIFIAKELNIKTIAEGVETKEQFKILKEMGCDYFQGYLFFKPMPEEEFDKLI